MNSTAVIKCISRLPPTECVQVAFPPGCVWEQTWAKAAATRKLLVFLEFDDEQFGGSAALRPVCNRNRCSRIARTAFDVVGNIAGVAQELNLVGLGGMEI